MDKYDLEALETAGFETTTVAEFLGLTEVEEKIVELRLQMSRAVRERREARGWTQKDLAKAIGSSQPRVAKIEVGAPDVSLDLIMRGFFAVGGELPADLTIAPAKPKPMAKRTVRPKPEPMTKRKTR